MKRSTILVLSTVMAWAGSSAMGTPYVEQFNTGNAGWLAVRTSPDSWPTATYQSSGGHPGGCISGAVTATGSRLFGFQPSNLAPYGNMTGLTLTVDYKINGAVTAPSGALVRFYVGTYTGGNNYFVSSDTFSWNPNMDTAWASHLVSLLQTNFILWPNQNAGNKSFAQVIAAPEDIGLVFADSAGNFGNNAMLGFSGNATISIDNFGTVVPEPTTLGLLAAGGVMVMLRRKHA